MNVPPSVKLLVDADILIKLSVYDCFAQGLIALGHRIAESATLDSMRFSAGLRKAEVRERRAGRGVRASRLLATLQAIPAIQRLTSAEEALAAALVSVSQKYGLSVDPGEAMLMSVSIERGVPYLTTGDKKAIASLPTLARHESRVSAMRGRVIPLEDVLLKLLARHGARFLYPRLIAGVNCDPGIDRLVLECGDDQSRLATALGNKLGRIIADSPGYLAAEGLPISLTQ